MDPRAQCIRDQASRKANPFDEPLADIVLIAQGGVPLPLLFSCLTIGASKPMQHLSIRLIARRSDIDAIITALCGVEGVQHIKLVDDLMPQMGENSPATTARPADLHPMLRSLEIELADTAPITAVRNAAEWAARERGIEPEFVEDT
jgi:hypothetical protein